jgi:N-acetylglucosaminyldiphosphoundecaprenol N-acetyl-beta-D-mannosaminyltransferase
MPINVFGYDISNDGLEANVSNVVEVISTKEKNCRYIACANPHSLVVARQDAIFSKALKAAYCLLPDGAGILLAAKILKMPINERVAGNDFFLKLSEIANEKKLRYFFLGSSSEVLSLIEKRLADEFPGIEVCGSYSPPYKENFSADEQKLMVSLINDARPDVLWVGMTAPKQEKWLFNSAKQLDVPVAAAIGAVFDFYAGTKKRAPAWVCKIGLEWLPRLLREPRRLWRRNFISTPKFLSLVLLQRLKM